MPPATNYPNPNARRRNARPRPSRGRSTPRTAAPELPDGHNLPPRLVDRWSALWCHEVAGDWDDVADLDTVTRYLRLLAEVDAGTATGATHAQIARLEDALGLSPGARQRRFLELARDEPEPESKTPPRRRIRVADPSIKEHTE